MRMTMVSLCLHCGEGVGEEDREEGDEENIYHKACKNSEIPRCQEAVEKFLDFYSSNKNVLYCGIHVHYLYGTVTKQDKNTKKRKRDEKLEEIVKKVSALRNSNSGYLLIQLVGMDFSDNYIGALDELLDDKFNKLIEDGNLFSNVFTKKRMSDYDGWEEYKDMVVLYVEASSFITTAEFKTKISLDEGIENPSPLTVFRYIKQKQSFEEIFPAVADTVGMRDLEKLQESRSLQVKSIKDGAQGMTADELTDYLIRGLRLTEYVSAFSKNTKGGTYLVGVREMAKHLTEKDYLSMVWCFHGVTLSDSDRTTEGIVEKVMKNILVCDYEGNILEDTDIVRADVVPCKCDEEMQHRFIIRIFVRPVTGMVFYDKSGPVAYEISYPNEPTQRPIVSRISLDKWFRIVHSTQLF